MLRTALYCALPCVPTPLLFSDSPLLGMCVRLSPRCLCVDSLAFSLWCTFVRSVGRRSQCVGTGCLMHCGCCFRAVFLGEYFENLVRVCAWVVRQRDGCPKIVNIGSARTDMFYERKKYGFKKR